MTYDNPRYNAIDAFADAVSNRVRVCVNVVVHKQIPLRSAKAVTQGRLWLFGSLLNGPRYQSVLFDSLPIGRQKQNWSWWKSVVHQQADVQKLFSVILYDRSRLGGVHVVKKSKINNKIKRIKSKVEKSLRYSRLHPSSLLYTRYSCRMKKTVHILHFRCAHSFFYLQIKKFRSLDPKSLAYDPLIWGTTYLWLLWCFGHSNEVNYNHFKQGIFPFRGWRMWKYSVFHKKNSKN